uniref:protein-tyrosine-phosphatase n=1 Tax=Tetraselmis sp. GSL018 TaxID=582737 RepID=A0A061QZR4_9CHLO|mmetsp:Transcript_25338/g.60277  ORF Transcript_25338/g.60277 Transcript_25338/m.60277 type:complete len:257 (+) Transcript_25338:240-1010(+)
MFGGPDEIRPGVYLGGFLSLEACQRLDIQRVLSVVDESSYEQIKEEILGKFVDLREYQLELKHIDLEDRPGANLLQHMDEAVQFIEDSLKEGKKVLVHCMAGISRSATIVAAFIMRLEGVPPEEAVKQVKKGRECVQPNAGFMKQLSAWHTMGNKVDTEHEAYWELFGSGSSTTARSEMDIPVDVPMVQIPDINRKPRPKTPSEDSVETLSIAQEPQEPPENPPVAAPATPTIPEKQRSCSRERQGKFWFCGRCFK